MVDKNLTHYANNLFHKLIILIKSICNSDIGSDLVDCLMHTKLANHNAPSYCLSNAMHRCHKDYRITVHPSCSIIYECHIQCLHQHPQILTHLHQLEYRSIQNSLWVYISILAPQKNDQVSQIYSTHTSFHNFMADTRIWRTNSLWSR